jgi:Family of unknown function (DUF6293)
LRSNLRVHIACVGFEVNRITQPILDERADKVYLITYSRNDKGLPYLNKILEILGQHKNIEVQKITGDIWDLFEILNRFKNILQIENAAGSHVYVNVSTGSKVAAIAGTLACMLWKGTPYYAHINYEEKRYFDGFVDDNVTEKTELPVYSINTPKQESITILKILNMFDGKVKKKKLIEKLEDEGLIKEDLSSEAKHSRLKALLNPLIVGLDSPQIKVDYIGRQSNVILTQQGESTLRIFGY